MVVVRTVVIDSDGIAAIDSDVMAVIDSDSDLMETTGSGRVAVDNSEGVSAAGSNGRW